MFSKTNRFLVKFCVLIVGGVMSADALAATITRHSNFSYDTQTGLLLTETIEPNKVSYTQTKSYEYDVYGNIVSVIVSGTDVESRTTSTVYDNRGQFSDAIVNALGHETTMVHDPRFSAMIEQTDPNDLVSQVEYDDLGRKKKKIAPDGNRVVYDYLYCSEVAWCPSNGAFLIVKTPQDGNGDKNGAWSKTYFDNLGRSILSVAEAENNTEISQITEYDKLGRVSRQSLAHFTVGGVAQSTVYWRVTEYDALGRKSKEIAPDLSELSFAYSGLKTSITNALGQTRSTVSDAQGNIVSATDEDNNTTTFVFDAVGNRTKITDSMGNITSFEYDLLGRRTVSNDPDLGRWTYSYNVLGELVSQKTARGQTTTTTYDRLGRPTYSELYIGQDDTLITHWRYDVGHKAIGKLSWSRIVYEYRQGLLGTQPILDFILDPVTAGNGPYRNVLPEELRDLIRNNSKNSITKTFTYDDFGRVTRTDFTPVQHGYETTYNDDGRIDTIRYPSGLEVVHIYDALGQLSALLQSGDTGPFVSSAPIWKADKRDAERRLREFTYRNGVKTRRAYDPRKGELTSVLAGVNGGTEVANFTFVFNELSNLVQRIDSNEGLTEAFLYDTLNRLTSYQIVGGVTKTVAYDELGNIVQRSDVGTYAYPAPGEARPHAVQSITGQVEASYTYDNNGSMIRGDGLVIGWFDANKVAGITKGSTTVLYEYGPDGHRYSQTINNVKTEYFRDEASGVLAEKVTGQHTVKWNNYIFAEGEMIGVFVVQEEQSYDMHYFTKDHLGSTSVLTNEDGNVIERLSYDAWGKRRHANGADDPAGTVQSQTTRGFTGHEMIDELGLVNMNARMYIPKIGRVMSADTVIQNMTDTQSLNRYTYVRNNPLSLTDPTGFVSKKETDEPTFFERYYAIHAEAARRLQEVGHRLASAFSRWGTGAAAQSATFGQGTQNAGVHGGTTASVATNNPKNKKSGATHAADANRVGGSSSDIRSSGRSMQGQAGGGYSQNGDADYGASSPGSSSSYGGLLNGSTAVAQASLGAQEDGQSGALGGGKSEGGADTAAYSSASERGNDASFDNVSQAALLSKVILARANANPYKVIPLSHDEYQTILHLAYQDVISKEVSYLSITDNFILADTVLYQSELTSRTFDVDGVGFGLGGEINYVGVGMMAAHYGFSRESIVPMTWGWNLYQYSAGEGQHNLFQSVGAVPWANRGFDYYEQQK